MTQEAFDFTEKPTNQQRFDGDTYVHGRDGPRLNAQLERVKTAMKDGAWRTLSEISAITGDPEASISARLRDLRKARFGSHTVEREYVERGLYKYRVVVNPEAKPMTEVLE